jgi:transposase
MDSKFIKCDRNTMYLLPPSVQDWLPEKHIARFIVEILEELDVSNIENTYSSIGRNAYPVRVLLGLLFYGYATGVYSSRKIEQATYDSIAFRYIAANLHPDHDTIADFRKKFSKEFDAIFLQVLLIASKMGILKIGNVSTDGSKIKANASKHKALSWEYANKLEQQLKDEIAKLKQLAESEENIPEKMIIPDELARREKRLTIIAAAKNEIQERAKKRYEQECAEYAEKIAQQKKREEETGKKNRRNGPKPPTPGPHKHDQVNLTDEESRIMPKSGGSFEQAFNAQLSVDHDTHLVVASYVTQHTNDKLEIVPTLEELKKTESTIEQKVDTLLADAGFFSEANIQHCENTNIKPLFAQKRDHHNKSVTERFESGDVELPEDANALEKMQHCRATSDGKKLYAERKATVEPVIGIIKNVMKFRQFSMRGLKAADGEWRLVVTAWNIKRLFALIIEQANLTTLESCDTDALDVCLHNSCSNSQDGILAYGILILSVCQFLIEPVFRICSSVNGQSKIRFSTDS